MILRDYQIEAIEALRRHLRAGKRRLLLVAPTGSGKTVCAAEIVRGATARGKSILFLAHRKELIDQASAKLDALGVAHGVIMARHPRLEPWQPVQVASIPTLRRRAKPPASLIITDEAHHARAKTWQTILDAYPNVPVIGLTATPWRTDGRGLRELFEELVLAATPAALVAQGHLVPCTGFVYDDPDLSAVETVGADYEEHGLSLAMLKPKIIGNILERWRERAASCKTILFACTIEHSKRLRDVFLAAGVRAEHIDGTMGTEQREGVLARLRSGATQLVSNCSVLTEGWDEPEVGCCILARPTQSLALYIQMVGRIRRPAPGKTVARLHDHSGNVLRHGLPDDERDYSLAGDADPVDHKAEPSLTTCPRCMAVFRGDRCPACGYAASVQQRMILHVPEGRIIELEKLGPIHTSDRNKREWYDRQIATARARGYKPGWVAHRFRFRFGHWPPKTWTSESAVSA